MVYPGTEAYEWAKQGGYLDTDDFGEWLTSDGLHRSVVSQPGLASQELVTWCDQARRAFYLRPRYMASKAWQILTRPAEAARILRAARVFVKYLMHPSLGAAQPASAEETAPDRDSSIGIRGPAAVIKRLLDVLGAVLGIVVFSPLMILAPILIKLSSRGPALFVQERVGKDCVAFRMYKYRTMVENAEDLLADLVGADIAEEPLLKIRNDPRVTPIGRVLRRWSIDELPQLINVLKGDMSLVGPRPEEVRLLPYYSSWQMKRFLAKPGVTGPAQTGGRADLPLDKRAQLEVDYIQHYSLARDIQILLQTIPAVLRGLGSY
jgi:lipopolysaccharide/colanic/teichoic acid biosynthesis glycosyltransferase